MSKGDKGNAVSKIEWIDVSRSWFSHHKQSALISLNKMLATPLQSVMTWFVIAIALALPAGLLIIVDNVNTLSTSWNGDPQLTVYMRRGLSEDLLQKTEEKLQNINGVMSVEYISPAQGLAQLKESGAFGDIEALLPENPLPPVFLLNPIQKNELNLKMLTATIQALTEVESVQIDLLWVQRLSYFVRLAERSVWLLSIFLCLGIFVTIANTIGLAIENRREEIIVIKLVGGTDAFVRRPLLYSGFWYGLAGGILAAVLLIIASAVLSPIIAGLLASYEAGFDLNGMGVKITAILLLGGSALGFAGAWLAVARHLKHIEPR